MEGKLKPVDDKEIFIFTSSGKPVFSRCGNEDDLVTTFGFLQAVISITLASGDVIKCIRSENRTIVFFLKNSLYFVIVSSTNEPESILLNQLNFLYNQILFFMTAKIHSVLENNPGADIQQLLGSDANRIIREGCKHKLVLHSIAFQAVSSISCEKSLREDINMFMKNCVDNSGAAVGLLLYNDMMFSYYHNPNTGLILSTSDVLLLHNFVVRSHAFRSSDQHWVPICLPEFNDKGYLQAYISKINESNETNPAKRVGPALTLILIAVSSDPESFQNLIQGKRYLEKSISLPDVGLKVFNMGSNHYSNMDQIRDDHNSLHFYFKYFQNPQNHPSSQSVVTSSSSSKRENSRLGISLSVKSSMKYYPIESEQHDSIWTEYQHLSLRLRRGTSGLESTLFSPAHEQLDYTIVGDKTSYQSMATSINNGTFAGSSGSNKRGLRFFKSESSRSTSPLPNASAGSQLSSKETPDDTFIASAFEDGIQLAKSLPNADHSLTVSVLSNGINIIALASYDCELFAAFPATQCPVEASTHADSLLRALRSSYITLFPSNQ